MYRPHLLITLVVAAALTCAGCADSSDSATGAAGENSGVAASADSSSSADSSASSDAGKSSQDEGTSWQGGGQDASVAADGSGQGGQAGPGNTGNTGGAGDNDGMGIGLKPGGAQDIGFFRSLVAAGKLPKSTDMTIEGWLNEHDTKLPAADPKRTIDMHALAAVLQPQGAADAEVVIQLGLNSAQSLESVEAKVSLTLVIDRSGSMSGDKLVFVKQGLEALLDKLPAGTELSIVSFSSEVTVDWPAKVYDAADKDALVKTIGQIAANGGTNLYGGLEKGLETCFNAASEFQFKRVLLLSDGQPTKGNTSSTAIIELAAGAVDDGCSVSTVGVGLGFNPQLMNAIAQKGNGTAWFLQNAAHAKEVFLNDLETMLLPVAEKLWISFALEEGWQVDKIYGFEWVEEDGVVTVLGPSSPDDVGPQPEPSVDGGSTGSDDDAGAKDEHIALPTLFASKKNGFIMVRLLPPPGADATLFVDLLLADLEYGYTLSKTGEKQSFQVPVEVPGLKFVADGGLAYFASPIVRRAFVLLHVGRAMQKACELAETGDDDDATAALDAALALVASQKAEMSADELAIFDMAPGLDDAADLLEALGAVLNAPVEATP